MAKILIVDDEQVILNFLVRVLARAGHQTATATDGQQALSLLDKQAFDLLLTDIKMEHLDGVDLLQEAREHFPEMAVVMLTGHATVESAVAALRHGASDYLRKPAKNEDILAAVDAALAERNVRLRRREIEKTVAHLAGLLGDDLPALETDSTPEVVQCGALEMHPASYKAYLGGEEVHLTPTEFRLLLALAQRPGEAVGYITLVEMACGYRCTRYEAQNIIGTHGRNLREKIGVEPGQPLYVEAVRGVGYRLIPQEAGQAG